MVMLKAANLEVKLAVMFFLKSSAGEMVLNVLSNSSCVAYLSSNRWLDLDHQIVSRPKAAEVSAPPDSMT